MVGKAEKIFNVYEKPEASDPVDRVVLVREGFSLWAFVLGPLWLLVHRLWRPLLGYMIAATALAVVCEVEEVSDVSASLMQLWLQLMLGLHAGDVKSWVLERRGYRFAGVLAAESPMHAERRYYEYAA